MKYLLCLFIVLVPVQASINGFAQKPAANVTAYWQHAQKDAQSFMQDRKQCYEAMRELELQDVIQTHLARREHMHTCMQDKGWVTDAPVTLNPAKPDMEVIHLFLSTGTAWELYEKAASDCQQAVGRIPTPTLEEIQKQLALCMNVRGWYKNPPEPSFCRITADVTRIYWEHAQKQDFAFTADAGFCTQNTPKFSAINRHLATLLGRAAFVRCIQELDWQTLSPLFPHDILEPRTFVEDAALPSSPDIQKILFNHALTACQQNIQYSNPSDTDAEKEFKQCLNTLGWYSPPRHLMPHPKN